MVEPNEDFPSLIDNEKEEEYRGFNDFVKMSHKMFTATNGRKWIHECLKLCERKVLYYFKVTSELKKNQGYQ